MIEQKRMKEYLYRAAIIRREELQNKSNKEIREHRLIRK